MCKRDTIILMLQRTVMLFPVHNFVFLLSSAHVYITLPHCAISCHTAFSTSLTFSRLQIYIQFYSSM
ncbi:hypothetical protein XELAEV_18015945mg [Xenopus laevis]|uniref:Uncharacterized protein n=1 Tax=Xenopus laevis TaxID=8355 RepID=A0A974DIX9_XENLA|nr:hypothetical protein XELAEV_18015945mg [Xenopus laevis]